MLRPALRTSQRFFCAFGSARLDHAARKPEVGHEVDQQAEFRAQGGRILAAELDQQNGCGPPDQGGLEGRPIARVLETQIDHDPVDQLDGGGAELDQVLGGLHRAAKAREVDHAQDSVRRPRRELQGERPGERETALGADQQMGQIDLPSTVYGRSL